MKKIKISEIDLAQQNWFQKGYNDMWTGKVVVSLENINDPRLWTLGILAITGQLDTNSTTFVSTKDGVKIPVNQGILKYTSALQITSTPHIIICEYSSSNVLLNRKYNFLPTEAINLNSDTAYIRVSIGSGNNIPSDANRAAIYGLRFSIT